MRRGTLSALLFILLIAACAAYIDWPTNPGLHVGWLGINNPLTIHQGLDLQGGVRVLLVPDPKQNYTPQQVQDNIDAARNLIEQRVNGGLGVSEPSIRVQDNAGQKSISVELPGLNTGNQDQAIQSLLRSGVLEFWSTGPQPATEGTAFDPSQYKQYNPNGPWFTGKDLDPSQLAVGTDSQTGAIQINFAMQGSAVSTFGAFTQKNIGNYLTVTLDKQVIQSASIRDAINGPGTITGRFTSKQAQDIVTLLRYGSLPISFKIASSEKIDPTLGIDSIRKSAIAAIIGLSMVILFMLLYYRLPGLLADLALILYAGLTLAVFKLIGVTLTLAGIAGFVLSIGMAVDANILIFERVKEELRAGRLLSSAIDIGWRRAWPSIRDSNFSTLITCAVLYTFGNNFGATIISGFATTLFLGVLISMFTAIVVTRTFLNLLVPTGVVSHPALFGLPAGSITTSSPSLARRNSTV
ncbi:MAG: protein translocase subunit SecD [Ktedonobacteraceae bacterium]|nr:protein translocase subunit SecD [Ktedonobacteraceae bacterium]